MPPEGLHLAVETEGVPKATNDVRELGVRASDVRAVQREVLEVERESTQRRFERRGPGWPPLAASTVERKAQQSLDPRILRATGELYKSLTEPSLRSEANRATPRALGYGTTVPYAGYAHRGTRDEPQRKLIDLAAGDMRKIVSIIGGYIATGRRKGRRV